MAKVHTNTGDGIRDVKGSNESSRLDSSPSSASTIPIHPNPRRQPPTFPTQPFAPSGKLVPSTLIPKASTFTTSAFPSPLPLLPLAPPQVASLRGQLSRRRSSYPPATTPGSSAGFTWVLGGTPSGRSADLGTDPFDVTFPSTFGDHIAADTVTDWSGLLEFDNTPSGHPPKLIPSSKQASSPVAARAKSEPREQKEDDLLGMNPSRIAQFGSDLAWKTILASVVDVDGVGEIGVCKVLQEVWKRGGGEIVTSQCLWPSIILSLCLSSTLKSDARIPTPSAQSAMALQELYNLTLKHWEPSIFSGLLTAYSATATPTTAAPAIDFPPVSMPKYGASTPTREFEMDLSQWTNLTPGFGGDFNSLFGTQTPSGSRNAIQPSNLGQFEFHVDHDAHRPSIGSIGGIDEILASMEKEQEAEDRDLNEAASVRATPVTAITALPASLPQSSSTSTFQLPTPETDNDLSSGTPRRISVVESKLAMSHFSPESMASPYVTGSSGTISHVSKELTPVASTASVGNRAAHPTSLPMPTEAFIPPPPMCMFFNPSFKDLQKGKVGVWKGDLLLRGKGGGTFNVLIVGEEVSGHLWQSHLWSSTLSHPVNPSADTGTSSFTSKMIPVAYLAREGFTPVTMGMVLCNDARIQEYVAMVQSLHSEGVAFHLPNSAGLPIVFLPAKFDPNDPLQRLGIAYMTKPGAPIPLASKAKAEDPAQEDAGRKKKRRRQSAPAKTVTSASGKRREAAGALRTSLRGRVEEQVIEEEAK